MKKLLSLILAITVIILPLMVSGCAPASPLDKNNPVTITMWHNYGGVMQKTMDVLVDSFNATIGRERGIIVTVSAVSSSAELTDNLNMIIDDDPAAMAMPNITVCYPKTAVLLAEHDMLADLYDYFDAGKLALYVDEFVSEGIIGDSLYVFPVAKSTEVLFLNQTLFDRFSAATGVTAEQLSTFEGIFDASVKYYDYCGKAFFTADSWFNLFSVAGQQSDDPFIVGNQLNTESETYKKLYGMITDAVAGGGIYIYNGYSSDLAKTGDIVCSLGSTAGILYYGDSVTYPDNTKESVDYTILPYPVMSGGKQTALQRGNGMVIKKSTEREEYASALFLSWLTEPAQNMQFITDTGYLPVTKEAYDSIVDGNIPEIENINIKKLLSTAVEMQHNYGFYIPPVYESFDSDSKTFESDFKNSAAALAPEK